LSIAQSMHKPPEPVEIRRNRARVDDRSVDAAATPVETLTAEIKSGIQTHLRDLLGSPLHDVRSLGEALPHHIRNSDSGGWRSGQRWGRLSGQSCRSPRRLSRIFYSFRPAISRRRAGRDRVKRAARILLLAEGCYAASSYSWIS